jgi:hypothetical protein
MALIVAAGIATAGGCYYGYERYKKVKRLRKLSGETSASTRVTCQPKLDDATRQAELEARKARSDALKYKYRTSTRDFFGAAAVRAALALALAVEALKQE